MFRRLREPVVSQPPYGVGTRPIGMPRCDTKLATHGAVAARTTARKTGSSSDFLKKLYGHTTRKSMILCLTHMFPLQKQRNVD